MTTLLTLAAFVAVAIAFQVWRNHRIEAAYQRQLEAERRESRAAWVAEQQAAYERRQQYASVSAWPFEKKQGKR